MHKECTFQDFIEIYIATILEMYELRYGLKLLRNNIAADMAKLVEYDRKLKDSPPTPVAKHDFMPPPKPKVKKPKRRKNRKSSRFSGDVVVQNLDIALQMTDYLDNILSDKPGINSVGAGIPINPDEPEGWPEEKKEEEKQVATVPPNPENSKDTVQAEEVKKPEEEVKKEEAKNLEEGKKQDENSSDPNVPAKKDVPAKPKELTAEEKEARRLKLKNERRRQRLDQAGYEPLIKIELKNTNLDRSSIPPGEENKPQWNNKVEFIKMRPYPIKLLDEDEVTKTHERNIQKLLDSFKTPEFREIMFETFSEVKDQFIEQDKPFGIVDVAEIFSGYMDEGELGGDPMQRTKYEFIPTPSTVVLKVARGVDGAMEHVIGGTSLSDRAQRFDEVRQTRIRFNPKRYRKHKGVRGIRKPTRLHLA